MDDLPAAEETLFVGKGDLQARGAGPVVGQLADERDHSGLFDGPALRGGQNVGLVADGQKWDISLRDLDGHFDHADIHDLGDGGLRQDCHIFPFLDRHIIKHAAYGDGDLRAGQPDAGLLPLGLGDRQLGSGGVHIPAGGCPFGDQPFDAVVLRFGVLGLGLGHLELGH